MKRVKHHGRGHLRMFNFFLELGDEILLVLSLHALEVNMALELLVIELTLLYFGALLVDLEGKLLGFDCILRFQIVETTALLNNSLVSL